MRRERVRRHGRAANTAVPDDVDVGPAARPPQEEAAPERLRASHHARRPANLHAGSEPLLRGRADELHHARPAEHCDVGGVAVALPEHAPAPRAVALLRLPRLLEQGGPAAAQADLPAARGPDLAVAAEAAVGLAAARA